MFCAPHTREAMRPKVIPFEHEFAMSEELCAGTKTQGLVGVLPVEQHLPLRTMVSTPLMPAQKRFQQVGIAIRSLELLQKRECEPLGRESSEIPNL